MSILVEAGLRDTRPEFVREVTYGLTPADPAWELFSDEVFKAEWEPQKEIFAKRALGSVDPQKFFTGPEAHTLTMEYYLQRWLLSAGDPLDPLGDAIVRDVDGNIPNSLSIVIRTALQVSGGAVGGGLRIYTVAGGCYAGQITIPGQIASGEPIRPNVIYQANKIRSYEWSQPLATTLLGIDSTNAADTTQTLTVENEAATTSQGAALNGTTYVSLGPITYADWEGALLDLETVGDVEISINTGTDIAPVKGTVLGIIYGSAQYAGTEGDLGLPLLGSGSHGAVIGTPYEQFIDDPVEQPAGTTLAPYIQSVEARINNNLETIPQGGTFRQIIVPGFRTTELQANVFGPSESHEEIMKHLRGVEETIRWTMGGGTIDFTEAISRDPPTRLIEVGQVTAQLDITFESKGVAVSG
jgi:hypothetical protein